MSEYPILEKKLEKFVDQKDQLDFFNREFIRILRTYYNDVSKEGPLFSDASIKDKNGHIRKAGVLNYPVFSGMIDRAGIGTQIFSQRENRFLTLPTKEYLLLSIVALGMYEHKEEILEAAGYQMYVKNMNELIILVGMNNFCSLDEIRAKLLEYGFRGEEALDYEVHDNIEQRDNNKRFHEILKKYSKHGQRIETIAYESGLIAVQNDSARNLYYYNAFSGANKRAFRITREQAMRLCEALTLDLEEKKDFLRELLRDGFIMDMEESDLVTLFKEGKEKIRNDQKLTLARRIHVSDVSVYTRMLEREVEYVTWENLDSFIVKVFGRIRSFASFFNALLEAEDVRVPDLKKRFAIGDSQLYQYLKGIGIPTYPRLSVLVTMLPQMTNFKYLQLMKKAGLFEFGEDMEDPLMIMVNHAISQSTREVCFGTLFDILEWVIINKSSLLLSSNASICEAYIFQVSILSNFFLRSEVLDKVGEEFGENMRGFRELKLTDLQVNLEGRKPKLLSNTIKNMIIKLSDNQVNYISNILEENYAFEEESDLLLAIEYAGVAKYKEEELER